MSLVRRPSRPYPTVQCMNTIVVLTVLHKILHVSTLKSIRTIIHLFYISFYRLFNFCIQMNTIDTILFYISLIFHIFLFILWDNQIFPLNLVTRSQQSSGDGSAEENTKKRSRSKKPKADNEDGNYCADFFCPSRHNIFLLPFFKNNCMPPCIGLAVPLLRHCSFVCVCVFFSPFFADNMDERRSVDDFDDGASSKSSSSASGSMRSCKGLNFSPFRLNEILQSFIHFDYYFLSVITTRKFRSSAKTWC